MTMREQAIMILSICASSYYPKWEWTTDSVATELGLSAEAADLAGKAYRNTFDGGGILVSVPEHYALAQSILEAP